ncbi:ABC transporter ATP-binding protein [Mesorhizobium sp. M1136]|uniref:ABC transporter ATP-binding protein n=2 Tax=unclassified Mesorhizobium TaxID=325217 RepID=UPI003339DAC9
MLMRSRMPDKAQIATPPASGVALRVDALTKRYGPQTALADVAFTVEAGEVLGLIGPNGAGKTTLLEAVAGVLPADSGTIFWHGAPLPPALRRRSIFYLPDGLRPWRDQYVERLLAFFAGVYRTSDLDVADTVRAVGLAPVLNKRVLALSKGYARRLMLALALITPHPLLLMDEPFDGFDLRQTREIMDVLRKVAAQGRSLVLAIHQLLDADRICDRFVLLAEGHVRGVGTLGDLRERAGILSGGLEEVFLALT